MGILKLAPDWKRLVQSPSSVELPRQHLLAQVEGNGRLVVASSNTGGLQPWQRSAMVRLLSPALTPIAQFGNLSIAPDSLPPSTTSASLTVAENTGPATIGIVPPADPNYSASQLSVRITGLPSDGTVLLSDAVTPVSLGESLTVAQLTGLKFSPLAGAFGTSSTFSYDVSNPSGLSTSGTATLAIGPDTVPPIATATSLTVAGNSATTPIGIAPPTDPNYAPSELTITVTALPTDGVVVLSDGMTPVNSGETLTVAQLAGLLFQPTAGTFGASSTFTYTVANPSGLTTSATTTLSGHASFAPIAPGAPKPIVA